MFSVYHEAEFAEREALCREWFSSMFAPEAGYVCVCGAWREEDGSLSFSGDLQDCLRPPKAADKAVSLMALGYEVFATCDSLRSRRDGHRSTYMRKGSESTNLLRRNCVMLDIDMHSGLNDLSEFGRYEDSGESSMLDALEAEWSSGRLPEPTAVFASGRGYHVYYILKDPVHHGGKPWRYLSDASSALDNAYDAVLGKFGTRVDRAVQSVAHLVRVPGSPNAAAGADMYCRKVSGHGIGETVSLHGIDVIDRDAAMVASLAKAMGKARPREMPADAARYAPFFKATMRRVEELAEMNGMDLGGRRNSALFAYQNAAYMVHGAESALDMALALNARLRNPLPAKEIEDSSKSIDSVGGYEISKETLAESFLMLTRDERAALRYDRATSPARLPRSEIPARNARLVELVASGSMTDEEVGRELGLCACTVCRMVSSFIKGRLILPDGFSIAMTDALRKRMRRHGVSSIPCVVEQVSDVKLDIFPNAVCFDSCGDGRPGAARGTHRMQAGESMGHAFDGKRIAVFNIETRTSSKPCVLFNIDFNNAYIYGSFQHIDMSFQHARLVRLDCVENCKARPDVRRCRDGPPHVAFRWRSAVVSS